VIVIRDTPFSRAGTRPELAARLREIRGPVGTPVAGWLSLSYTRRYGYRAQYTRAHTLQTVAIERPTLADAVETVLAFSEAGL
jgi:hypothetical protein